MITVNNCPFCGDENVEIDEITVESGPALYAVDCQECEAVGPIRDDIMTAIEDWNRAPQRIVNRDLLAAAKDLVKRITLDDIQLREVFAYEAHGRTHNFFDEHYQPLIDILNAAIAKAEAA